MNKLVLVQIMAFVGALMLAGCEDDPTDLAFTHVDAGGPKAGGSSGSGGSAQDAGKKPASDGGADAGPSHDASN